MPIYDAILFDFDGVLADTEPLHCQCWAEILKPFGYELTWETFVREFVGVSEVEKAKPFAYVLAVNKAERNAYRKLIPEKELALAVEEYRKGGMGPLKPST